MPELPEVETVRRGLLAELGATAVIARCSVRRRDLRRPIPGAFAHHCRGALRGIDRRAKYLLWRFDHGSVLNHLGMTGSWRRQEGGSLDGHDHVVLDLADGRRLVYRDPRRFGVIEWIPPQGEASHPSLATLGLEPLDPVFDGAWLHRALSSRRGAVKAAIMDQKLVVGVGNIYAAEALYRAGIHPRRRANRVARPRCDRLAAAITAVLTAAIESGGSTIRDFRSAGGSEGWFQHHFQVYGRAGEPCLGCGAILTGAVIAGRSTVWCPRCQR